MTYQRLKSCDCSFCTYDEITSPDTYGEYTGIDKHMEALARLLDAHVIALEMIRDGRLNGMDPAEYARLFLEIGLARPPLVQREEPR